MVSATPIRAVDFKSAYGPKYQFQPHVGSWSGQMAFRVALRASMFGGAAVVGALLFTSGIPRIQKDVLYKFGLEKAYHKEVHPQDNPF